MRFWDSSAIVPLLIEEAATETVRGWLEADADIALWAFTWLEVVSAIERRVRDGAIAPSLRQTLSRRMARIAADAHEVSDVPAVRARALRLVARYPLRAADAAQLGAALLIAEPDPTSLTMVVLDRRLADAADREGLGILHAA